MEQRRRVVLYVAEDVVERLRQASLHHCKSYRLATVLSSFPATVPSLPFHSLCLTCSANSRSFEMRLMKLSSDFMRAARWWLQYSCKDRPYLNLPYPSLPSAFPFKTHLSGRLLDASFWHFASFNVGRQVHDVRLLLATLLDLVLQDTSSRKLAEFISWNAKMPGLTQRRSMHTSKPLAALKPAMSRPETMSITLQ